MVTSRPEIVGTYGVVATTHWLSTTVGMTILERNASMPPSRCRLRVAYCRAGTDRVATSPSSSGPLQKQVDVICGQGVASPRVSARSRARPRYHARHRPHTGGSRLFGAWMLLLQEYGDGVRDVLSPATPDRAAFHVKPEVSSILKNLAPFFKKHWPSSAAVFLPGGERRKPIA